MQVGRGPRQPCCVCVYALGQAQELTAAVEESGGISKVWFPKGRIVLVLRPRRCAADVLSPMPGRHVTWIDR